MIEMVRVALGGRYYDITIGENAALMLVPYLEKNPPSSTVIVTDSKVGDLYGEDLLQELRKTVEEIKLFTFPEGEQSKSFGYLEPLCRDMARSGMDREGLVLALGGGVVGDLAGLAASIYLRGVRLIQLPTTLLSMVDSSVGGKTGINISEGKNLVGTFYQPEAVFADISVLRTLNERDWYSGLAEVIKIALTLDSELFNYLESVDDLGPSGELDITRTVAAVLGHGVEAALGYGVLRHGEAVLLGMRAALNLSSRISGLPADQLQRAMDLIGRLPVPEIDIPEDITRFIVRDKKSSGDLITAVLIKEIGKHEFVPLEDPLVLVEELYKS
jgi:3-dehydroquinate synthetase